MFCLPSATRSFCIYSKCSNKDSSLSRRRAFFNKKESVDQTILELNFEIPKSIIENARKHLEVLTHVNLDMLENNINHYKALLCNPESIIRFNNFDDTNHSYTNELRTLYYCAFLHPVCYEKNGLGTSWYSVDCKINSLYWNLFNGKPSYRCEGINKLDGYLHNQKNFILKIKSGVVDLNNPIKEESLQRYRQYMALVKVYQEKLSPPFDVDILWHTHMLNHAEYVQHTKMFFGYILDHNDSISNKEILKMNHRTRKLWDQHFPIDKDKFLYQNSKSSGSCGTEDLSPLQKATNGQSLHHKTFFNDSRNSSQDSDCSSYNFSSGCNASNCSSCGSSCG